MYWSKKIPESENDYYYWKKSQDSPPILCQIVGDSIYGIGTAWITYIEAYEEQQFLGPLPTVEDLLAIDDIDRELA